MSNPTRLLVLGVVRIMGPVHGYDVRRELQSWRLEDWTNSKPGSVYSALRTLEKDGLVERVDDAAATGGGPERTSYVITGEGQKEFEVMLRDSWWVVRQPSEPLVPAMCLMMFLSRDELIAALQARIGQLEGRLDQLRFTRSSIRDGATGAEGGIPEHVREIFDFGTARLQAEVGWARGFVERLRSGAYRFRDEWAEADDC